MSSQSLTVIKGISITLIAAAIGLELWALWGPTSQGQLPEFTAPILKVAQIALLIHCIEGLVAAAYASSRKKQPLLYGLYTFFTGFVGLKELFDQQEHPQ